MSRDILTIVADLRRCERSYRAGTMSRHDYAISRGWAWGRAKALDITTEVAEAYLTLPAAATADIEAARDAEDAESEERGSHCCAPNCQFSGCSCGCAGCVAAREYEDRRDADRPVREPDRYVGDCDVREPHGIDDLGHWRAE